MSAKNRLKKLERSAGPAADIAIYQTETADGRYIVKYQSGRTVTQDKPEHCKTYINIWPDDWDKVTG